MKSFTGFQTLKFSSGFVKCILEYCSGSGGGNGYHPGLSTLREKCPKTEFFLVRIFPYSGLMRENTDHKTLRI